MRLFAFFLAAALASSAAFPAHAADRTVEARLDAAGLKYEIDEDGDYRVVISYKEEGRTQLVFISGAKETFAGKDVREVFSPAAHVDDDNVGDKAIDLLRDSRRKIVGGWEIGGNYLFYVVKFSDDIDAKELLAIVEIVAELADDKEIELSGDKDAL